MLESPRAPSTACWTPSRACARSARPGWSTATRRSPRTSRSPCWSRSLAPSPRCATLRWGRSAKAARCRRSIS